MRPILSVVIAQTVIVDGDNDRWAISVSATGCWDKFVRSRTPRRSRSRPVKIDGRSVAGVDRQLTYIYSWGPGDRPGPRGATQTVVVVGADRRAHTQLAKLAARAPQAGMAAVAAPLFGGLPSISWAQGGCQWREANAQNNAAPAT